MEVLVPKYRRDPNEKVDSIYQGIAPGNRTVTVTRKASADRNSMETTKVYGPGLARGESGRIGVLVLGGMETSLDEMEYILEAKRQKKFVPRRSAGQIAEMCRMLIERRNDLIRHYQKKPSEIPTKRRVRLHLPVGYRMVKTSEPGLRIRERV